MWVTRHMTHVGRMTCDLGVALPLSSMTLRPTLLQHASGCLSFLGRLLLHCVDGPHFVTTRLSRDPRKFLPALCCGSAAVHLGVRPSESLLSVPWGGDPEVGLPRCIVILY